MDTLPAFAHVLTNDRSDVMYWIVRAVFFVGALRAIVFWTLDIARRPEIQAIGRWLAQVARRAYAAFQAARKVPDGRRHRPLLDMTLSLGTCASDYLFAVYFFGMFALGIALLVAYWPTIDMTKGVGILGWELAMALLTGLYKEQGRRKRVELVRRWKALRNRRALTGLALAFVPASFTLIGVVTTMLR